MPKEKSCRSVLFKQWIGGDRNFTTDGKIMFCQPCSKEVKCEKKYPLEQHKHPAIHMKNSEKKTGSQPIFPKVNDADKTQEQFSVDLCSAMIAANIPWKKLENPDFNAFLNKYTNMKNIRRINSEETLRAFNLFIHSPSNKRWNIGVNSLKFSVHFTLVQSECLVALLTHWISFDPLASLGVQVPARLAGFYCEHISIVPMSRQEENQGWLLVTIRAYSPNDSGGGWGGLKTGVVPLGGTTDYVAIRRIDSTTRSKFVVELINKLQSARRYQSLTGHTA
uniref:Uncharacterized protein n=1 Tax=Timema monikensis TaxID=170555 RepID=A0A7R9EAW1_9NEOP|nr:unnamed protein product [Timema monikensis]